MLDDNRRNRDLARVEPFPFLLYLSRAGRTDRLCSLLEQRIGLREWCYRITYPSEEYNEKIPVTLVVQADLTIDSIAGCGINL